ncbi:hypothetical protein EG329_005116 [Mollisiaceae sp. DMI_Dod_QoI]|nr:hypothetical protein EG329_005116 [Helotiales sp. DMI_Dod_QoI]
MAETLITEEATRLLAMSPKEIIQMIKDMNVQQLIPEQEFRAQKVHDILLEPVIFPEACDPQVAVDLRNSKTSQGGQDPAEDAIYGIVPLVSERVDTVGARAMNLLLQSIAQRGIADDLVEQFVAELMQHMRASL